MEPSSPQPHAASTLTNPDDERPPLCPTCNKRLVILATQSPQREGDRYVRQQLWGCPRGHATAIRRAGIFQPVEVLAELVG